MEDFNKMILKSRYPDVETVVTKTSDNTAEIETNSAYIRIIGLDQIEGIDFEGGPMINVGDSLFGKKIKSIGHNYKITLE